MLSLSTAVCTYLYLPAYPVSRRVGPIRHALVLLFRTFSLRVRSATVTRKKEDERSRCGQIYSTLWILIAFLGSSFRFFSFLFSFLSQWPRPILRPHNITPLTVLHQTPCNVQQQHASRNLHVTTERERFKFALKSTFEAATPLGQQWSKMLNLFIRAINRVPVDSEMCLTACGSCHGPRAKVVHVEYL